MRVALITLGCKTNHAESASLAERFREAGFTIVEASEEADIYILNSCTVTHEAGRKCEQQLRRLRRLHPGARIAVMGCHAQLKDLSQVVDFQRGVMDRLDLLSWARACRGDAPLSPSRDISIGPARQREFESLGLLSEPGATRAIVKIQDGCELFCSYCAICLARGPVRSRDRAEILAEVRQLAARDVQEIVLTGIHLCSFEKERGRDSLALAELCAEIAEIPAVRRIRLGSLEPNSMSDEVLERLAEIPELCPHFHLSLQSGSDSVLQRMRRRYTAEDYRQRVLKIRELFVRPALTTDLMVGFPEETEEEHQESLAFVRELELSRLHIFRYSPRAKTPAASWPQLPPELSKARAQEAQQLTDFLLHKFLVQNLPFPQEILLEEEVDGHWEGYSRNYIRCRLLGTASHSRHSGQILTAQPVDIVADRLQLREMSADATKSDMNL